MAEVVPFELEDFFYEYEHRRDLLNLASSDAAPWKLRELRAACPQVDDVLQGLEFGYPDVKGLVVPQLERFYGRPEGVAFLPTGGGAEGVYLSLQSCRLGRDTPPAVAVPSPGYGAFRGVAQLLGCRISSYRYRSDREWQLDADEFLDCARAHDVLVVINPHNPTGSILDRALLEEASDVLAKHHGTMIVDEVFRLPRDCPTALDLGANVVVVGSLSKVYGLPGLRLGWVAAHRVDFVRKIQTLQQYLTLSLSSLSVHLGSLVLGNCDRFGRRDLLATNRELLVQWEGHHRSTLKITEPQAGTTVILELLDGLEENRAFVTLLDHQVLLVPGLRCFGAGHSAWFRLGYGGQTDALQDGLNRVSCAVQKLRA